MNVKKIVLIAVAFALLIGVGTGFSLYSNKSVITSIDFPKAGQHIPSDALYEIDSSVFSDGKIKQGGAEGTDKVFAFINKTVGTDKVEKLKNIFNLSSSQKSSLEKSSIYKNNEHYLQINDDGTFIYHKIYKNKSENVSIPDEDCKKIAKDFLSKNGLLPFDFYITGVGYETVTSVKDESNSKVLRKEVYFNRKINSKDVYGVSRIIVVVGKNGDIESTYSLYKDYSNAKSVKIKSFNTAFDDLKQLKGMISMDSNTKKVQINKVELVYWESSSPNSKQSHIQPVYHFLGETIDENGKKRKYEGFVAAVPDSLTTLIEEPHNENTPTQTMPKVDTPSTTKKSNIPEKKDIK